MNNDVLEKEFYSECREKKNERIHNLRLIFSDMSFLEPKFNLNMENVRNIQRILHDIKILVVKHLSLISK
jgi:hypothetical protein